ncbi:MAG: tetratricopeptide repeat protein, partial [Anaerolineales bacterium]
MRVSAAKLTPPSVPATAIHRPALLKRLRSGLRRRLTTVVGGAGFGKSTLLAMWDPGVPRAWYTVDRSDASVRTLERGILETLRPLIGALPAGVEAAIAGGSGEAHAPERSRAWAALICDSASGIAGDIVLVLDDLHELGQAGASIGLVESLIRQAPAGMHLVLASREDPPFPVDRLRGQGQVLAVTAGDLAFDVEEIEALVADAAGPGAGDHESPETGAFARALREATGGWPAAVRLAIESLRHVAPEEWTAPASGLGSGLHSSLAGDVLRNEPAHVRRLMRSIAKLDRFTDDLCGHMGLEDAVPALPSLVHRGLLVEEVTGRHRWLSPNVLLREFILNALPLADDEWLGLNRRAAAWFAQHGLLTEALLSLAATGDDDASAELLTARGDEMITA